MAVAVSPLAVNVEVMSVVSRSCASVIPFHSPAICASD
jgi:hypothetical protein